MSENVHRMYDECAFSMSYVSSFAKDNGSQFKWFTCMLMVADLSNKGDAKKLLMNNRMDSFSIEE